jgi:hypothetical protein
VLVNSNIFFMKVFFYKGAMRRGVRGRDECTMRGCREGMGKEVILGGGGRVKTNQLRGWKYLRHGGRKITPQSI